VWISFKQIGDSFERVYACSSYVIDLEGALKKANLLLKQIDFIRNKNLTFTNSY